MLSPALRMDMDDFLVIGRLLDNFRELVEGVVAREEPNERNCFAPIVRLDPAKGILDTKDRGIGI